MFFLNIFANSWQTKSVLFNGHMFPKLFPVFNGKLVFTKFHRLLQLFILLVFCVFQDIVLTPFRFNHFGRDSTVFRSMTCR